MTRPIWLNPAFYPFAGNYLEVESGRMHYLDEGEGVPIVMVHGTPSWSFLYRHLVRGLADSYRCVAPDQLGFGLSDKPEAFAYTPVAHAENLGRLIDKLELKDIVLVVHDFGGPIGLSYALEHPENVRALVVMNTWLWPNASLERAGKVLGNPLGRFLYTRLNFSVNVPLQRLGFADRTVLTDELLKHYREPFPTPRSRKALYELVATIAESNGWFETLWDKRVAIADKPALLLWGMKDKLVPPSFLTRWQTMFENPETSELDAGHFLQEEAKEQITQAIRDFLEKSVP